MNSYNKLLLLIPVLIVLFFTGCQKDELNSKELIAYIKLDNTNATTKNINFSRNTFKYMSDSIASIVSHITRDISSDVVISVGVDESLVNQFNSENQTDFEFLSSSSYKLTGPQNLVVKSGQSTSTDSIKIKLTDLNSLTRDNGYILPLSIKKIASNDKGVRESTNFKTIFITVTSEFNAVDPLNPTIAGSIVNRTNWSVISSGNYSNYTVENILDGNNSTAWDSNGAMPAWVRLDMGAAKTIKGFSIVPNYVFISDNFLEMEVYSSSDDKNWKLIGKYIGMGTAATSSPQNPDIKNVKFLEPQTARYFKFNILRSTDGGYTGMAELNAIE